MGVVVQRKGTHEKVGFVKDWRVDVSVAERNMTKMMRNREWDHLHAEDTSTDIQKLTITYNYSHLLLPGVSLSSQHSLSFLSSNKP